MLVDEMADIQAYSLKHNITSHGVIFRAMSFKMIIITVLAAMAVHAAPSSRAADISGDGELLWGTTIRTIVFTKSIATYYLPNGAIGACGHPIQNNDLAVALGSSQYSGGSNCGRRINVHCE